MGGLYMTAAQARRFILLKQGLIGAYRFSGEKGVLDFVRQAGCIQFDPIDVCGRNAELVLQSRVKGFNKKMLDMLLYRERKLFDFLDKNVSVIPIEDWPYFERYRRIACRNIIRYPQMQEHMHAVRSIIRQKGAVSSGDIKLDDSFYWQSSIHWSGGNNVSRSVLEQMYSAGELIIHHKNGNRKYYDSADKHIAPELLNAPDPFPDDYEHIKWRLLRRIASVGMLWNRPSDAWLNICGLTSKKRTAAFEELEQAHKIISVEVAGIESRLYIAVQDETLYDLCRSDALLNGRCEVLAPLDNMLWDRKLIKALFDFDYKWEIYTPSDMRKYGHYVLPVLFGEQFIGRAEAVVDRKTQTLIVKNIWYEDGVKHTKKMHDSVARCMERFAKFNDCAYVTYAAH